MHERSQHVVVDSLHNLGPQLVPPLQPRHSALALWHLLSLDAPTVAALWTYFIARCADVSLPWTATASMFVAVWMIYAADRLLDARLLDARQLDQPSLTAPADLEERHRFHHRHRARFLGGVAVASLALVFLLPHINPHALVIYTLLAALLGGWMLLIHALPQRGDGARRLPKELAVGLFFPAACFIPTIARAPALQPRLLPAAVAFAALCTLNCLLLYAWEHPLTPRTLTHTPPRANTQPQALTQPQAHWTTLWSILHLRQIALVLLALSLVIAALDRFAAAPALACALGTALLLALHLLRHRIAPIHLRAAADLALLSPLLWLAFWLLHR